MNIDYIIKLFLPTSDVVVVAGEEKFYCHKIILSARCEVFKNMLAPNTIESETNTISEYIFLRCSRIVTHAKCIASYTTRRAEEGVTIDR